MQDKGIIALVQEAPAFLNLPESIARAVNAIERVAGAGATVIGFPECWAPGYPVWLDFAPNAALWDETGAKQLFRLLYENAVVAGDRHLEAIQSAADKTGAVIVFGAHERAGNTLYNTTFTCVPGGKPLPHRKLVPTYTERLVWGRGDGSTLETVETQHGTVGSLICWEHWMPLARAAMHAKTETIHIAQWPAANDVHQLASRHYAFEGRCIVGAAGSYLSKGDVIEGFKSLNETAQEAEAMLQSMPGDNTTLIHNGGSAVIDVTSSYITEPVYNQPGIITGAFDLSRVREAAQTLDTAGHYSRPDVFNLTVNTKPQSGVTFAAD